MNIFLAFVFGLVRTPALLYFAVTGVVVYLITNVLRIVFLPLKVFETQLSGLLGLGLSLFVLIAATHGFMFLKEFMQPLLDTNLLVTVPTVLLTFESMASASLEGFYMLPEAVPTPSAMFDWGKAYIGDWDVQGLFVIWWVALASQLGPYIYYLCHRLFYVLGMEK